MTDHADLIARLKRHREVMGRDMLEWELVNPDGPEAASAIDALMNDVRVLKADLDRSEDNVARLIVERDEARAYGVEARIRENKAEDARVSASFRAERAEAERDEARALLREAHEGVRP